MSNNCLVTKYNGSINNENAPLFNLFKFEVGDTSFVSSRAASYILSAVASTGKTAKAYVTDQDKYFTMASSDAAPHLEEYEWTSNGPSDTKNFHCKVGNMDLFIENKYNLISLNVGGRIALNVEELEYCDLSEKIYAEYAVGNLDKVKHFPNSKQIDMNNYLASAPYSITNDIEGDISVFSNCTSCEILKIRKNPNLTGNISSLGTLTNLTELQVEGCSGIVGSIEDFVAAQITNGRTTLGSENAMKVHGILGEIPFGGGLRNTGNNQWLTWESASKIVIYGGESTSNYTKVVAKGATQQEIAAWQTALGAANVVHFDDAN